MRYVVENEQTNEIIGIFANKQLAEHFVKFLPFDTKVNPMDYYDFHIILKIVDFMK